MNNADPDSISLEEMRRMSIRDLIKLDLEILRALQKKANDAAETARRAQFWINGVIGFKLCRQRQDENGQSWRNR